MEQTATGLIFDVDGLMVDTERPFLAALCEAVREQGGPALSVSALAGLCGRSCAEADLLLAPLVGQALVAAGVRRRAEEIFWRDLPGGVPEKRAGLETLLQFVRQHPASFAPAIGSSADRAWVLRCLGPLAEAFPVLVTREDVPRAKPAPDIYLEAARRLGIAAGRCIVLDDADAGVEAALAAGMLVLQIPDGSGGGSASNDARHFLLASLDEARDFLSRRLSA